MVEGRTTARPSRGVVAGEYVVFELRGDDGMGQRLKGLKKRERHGLGA